ncbi:MAG TPA: hypothetical protein VLE99_01475 [Candidatus Saccharimonadales bacterium]|nr:hypothetical protein [Candidatus Saccharimonadales bacterium]
MSRLSSRLWSFVPTSFETWCVLFVSLAIVALGNAQIILARFGLVQSSELVQARLGHGVTSGLTKLDSFTITQTAATFLVWAGIGLVAFSFVYAVLRTSERIEYRKALSSNEYIHPAAFNRASFMRTAITGALLSFTTLVLFLAGTALYLHYVMPSSFVHIRRFLLLDPSLSHFGSLCLGAMALFAGTYVLYALGRLTVWSHRTHRI